MGRKQKKKYPAYFTLEATLVMPFVLLVMVLLLFLAIYTYDRCILEQSAYQAALRAANHQYTTNQEAYDAAKEAAASLIENKIFAVNQIGNTIVVTDSKVCVAYNCKVNLPLASWLRVLCSDRQLDIYAEKEIERSRQVERIRFVQQRAAQ